MIRNTVVILLVLISILSGSSVSSCAQYTGNTDLNTENMVLRTGMLGLPSFNYPDIPKYYPNEASKYRFELLSEAENEQEIVAWADQNKLPRIIKPGHTDDVLVVFTNILAERVVLTYRFRRSWTDPKPWKLQQVKPVGLTVFDDLSCVYLGKNGLVCKSRPDTKFKDGYDYSGEAGYRYPNLPKSYGWTEIRGKHEIIGLLPTAKNRQDIVKWADQNGLSYYLQLDEPFGRFFLVMGSFGFGRIDYDAYLYGDLGKGTEPWRLLYVGAATNFFSSDHDLDDLNFGLCAYVDRKTRNLVFSSSKGVAYGTVNIENELKMVYGDKYDIIVGNDKPK